MKKILVGILVIVLAGFIGLAIQAPVQHELNMRRDSVYATAYTEVVPLGYSMNEAYEIAGNEYYDEAKLLVEWYDYTFEEAFKMRSRYNIAVGIEEALPFFDVLFVEMSYGDIAILGSLNLDLVPEGLKESEFVAAITAEIREVYPKAGFRYIYIVFGFDQVNKAHMGMQLQTMYSQPNFIFRFPLNGELAEKYMPWRGPNQPLTSD